PEVRFAAGAQSRAMPIICGSASIKGTTMTLTLTNVHARLPADVALEMRGSGEVISAAALTHEEIQAHNTFESPNAVVPHRVDAPTDGRVLHLPPASVNVFRLRSK